MASTEQRDKLRQYLLEQEERRKRMDSPEYQGSLGKSIRGSAETDADNSYVSLLMDSAAKMGTLGGKQADASPVARHADVLRKTNADFRGDMAAESANKEKRYSDNLKLREYFAGKEQEGEDQELSREQAALKAKREAAQAAVDQANKDREFALKQKEADAKIAEAGKPKQPTAEALASANYGRKAQDADKIIKDMEAANYDPSSYLRAARNPNIPLVGGLIKSVASSDDDRRYQQAQKEFIAAILRKESGGAITPEEFSEYGSIFFPQAGDGPDVIAQKAAARQAASDNLIAMSGEAANQIKNRPSLVLQPKKDDGTAIAAPQTKELDTMSDEELLDFIKANGGTP